MKAKDDKEFLKEMYNKINNLTNELNEMKSLLKDYLNESHDIKDPTRKMDLSKLDDLLHPKKINIDSFKREIESRISEYNKREITALASIIYHGDLFCLLGKDNTFSKWLNKFSGILGVETPTYKASQVRVEIDRVKNEYISLDDISLNIP